MDYMKQDVLRGIDGAEVGVESEGLNLRLCPVTTDNAGCNMFGNGLVFRDP